MRIKFHDNNIIWWMLAPDYVRHTCLIRKPKYNWFKNGIRTLNYTNNNNNKKTNHRNKRSIHRMWVLDDAYSWICFARVQRMQQSTDQFVDCYANYKHCIQFASTWNWWFEFLVCLRLILVHTSQHSRQQQPVATAAWAKQKKKKEK